MNLLLLTNLLPSHTTFMSIYFYLWITINALHLSFIYHLTYPCYSMRVMIFSEVYTFVNISMPTLSLLPVDKI